MSTTKGSVPGQPVPYSDHEALTVELRLEAQSGRDRQSKGQDSSAGIVLAILASMEALGVAVLAEMLAHHLT